jgi:hypothetical protein
MNAIDSKELDTIASVTGEHDAAYRLFQLISETERWWTATEQPPTRDEILDCYAKCVAAARGEKAPTDAAPSEASTPIIEIIPVAGHPVHCAARYEASLDLAAATPPEAQPALIWPLDHCDLKA